MYKRNFRWSFERNFEPVVTKVVTSKSADAAQRRHQFRLSKEESSGTQQTSNVDQPPRSRPAVLNQSTLHASADCRQKSNFVRSNSDDSLNLDHSTSDTSSRSIDHQLQMDPYGLKSVDERDCQQYDIVQQGPDVQDVESPKTTRNSSTSSTPQHKAKQSLDVTYSTQPAATGIPTNHHMVIPASVPANQQPVHVNQHIAPVGQQSVGAGYMYYPAAPQPSNTYHPQMYAQMAPPSHPGGYYYQPYHQQYPGQPGQPPMYHAMTAAPHGYYIHPYQSAPWLQGAQDYQMAAPPAPALSYPNLVYQPRPPFSPPATNPSYQLPYHQQHQTESYQQQKQQFEYQQQLKNESYKQPNNQDDDDEPSFTLSVSYQSASNIETVPSPPVRTLDAYQQHTSDNVVFRRPPVQSDISYQCSAESYQHHEPDHHQDEHDQMISGSDISNISGPSSFSESPYHTNRYHTGAKLELEHGRTPLFGLCPTWWGENEAANEEDDLHMHSNVDQRTRPSPQLARKLSNLSESEPKKFESPQHESNREEFAMFSANQAANQEEADKQRPVSGALSFTIDFEENKKKRTVPPIKPEDQWKLQSAERVHKNFVRRSLRKAGGVTSETHPLTTAACAKEVQSKEQELRQSAKDPKAYLLIKMLADEAVAADEPAEDANSHKRADRRSSDAGSDAGTYVVDRDQEVLHARSRIDKVFGVESASRSSSSSCERTPSPSVTSYEEAVINKPRAVAIPAPPPKPTRQSFVSSKALTASKVVEETEDDKAKKGLLKQLAKISQQPEHRRSLPATAASSKSECAPMKTLEMAPRKSILKTTSSSVLPKSGAAFGRADTGRLSLRSQTVAPKPPISTKSKTVGVVKPNPKDNEMNLWLRRKEYNPMKAAAEAKNKKSVPISAAIDPPYLSNRSQSFHTTAIVPKGMTMRKHQSIEDSLNSDVDDFDIINNPSSSVANYSRNFATSLNRLSNKGVESDGELVVRRSIRSDSKSKVDSDSLASLERLSKELGTHAKDVMLKLQSSSKDLSKSADDISTNQQKPQLEEDSMETSSGSGITGLVKHLELANHAFEILDKYLKTQNDKGTGEPSDPTTGLVKEREFKIRPTRLTKLESPKASHSRGRMYSEKE